jgi:hypothetical protein
MRKKIRKERIERMERKEFGESLMCDQEYDSYEVYS